MPDDELITVAYYSGLPEAELAQGILGEAGIESVILDDNVGHMLSWIAIGGFRLQVNKDDVDAATRLVDAVRGEDQPATASAQQARCPNCGSIDVVPQASAPCLYRRLSAYARSGARGDLGMQGMRLLLGRVGSLYNRSGLLKAPKARTRVD